MPEPTVVHLCPHETAAPRIDHSMHRTPAGRRMTVERRVIEHELAALIDDMYREAKSS